MPLSRPHITYISIKINNVDIMINNELSYKCSFIPPYNQIQIKFRSDVALTNFEARISDANIPLSQDENEQKIVLCANVPANQQMEVTLTVTSFLFNRGDIDYRVLLCGRSSADGTWDLTQLFLTSEGLILRPVQSDGLTVPIKMGGV